jgi:AcrR family transcriptional regulator
MDSLTSSTCPKIEPVKVGQKVTPRDRVRAEVTREILMVAKQHLGTHGAAALSLRAVAREVGMVSSAIYRYFPSRDDLLTALIVDGFEQIAGVVETADASAPSNDFVARWTAVGLAFRQWAQQHPYEYGLVYGTPIPGYVAPRDTIPPVERTAMTLVAILREGLRSGLINIELQEGAFAASPLQLAHGDMPFDVLTRGLQAWSALIGMITFDLFGHLNNVIDDRNTFFETGLRRLAELVIGRSHQ